MKFPNLKNITPLDALLGAGALFLIVLTISAVTLLVVQLSKPTSGYEGRTINVSATGDAYQVPDRAEFTYTVRKEGKDVATTQAEVTEQSNTVIATLKSIGVQSEDIQTQNITANPRYEWQTKQTVCTQGYCPTDGKNVLVGYESSVTTSVRVKDFGLTGKILATLGEANVFDIQGPRFTNEDPDAALSEARNEALARARKKAQEMARSMGVRLGKVVSFSDSQDGIAMPMYAGKMELMAADSRAFGSAPVQNIEAGQDKVSVTVNVIYRIK